MAAHQDAHSWTNTHKHVPKHYHVHKPGRGTNIQAVAKKTKKVKAAKTQRRKAGRSYSPSQGQWHTSAWIITLSHSASRQRITSCTEASARGRKKEEEEDGSRG